MNKLIFFALCIISTIVIFYSFTKLHKLDSNNSIVTQNSTLSQESKVPVLANEDIRYTPKIFSFLPTWVNSIPLLANVRYMYFASNTKALITNKSYADASSYITLSVTNKDEAFAFVTDKAAYTQTLTKYVDLLKTNNKKGLVLNIEFLPEILQPARESFVELVRAYKKELSKQDLELYVVVYGDTYYKNRPYNIAQIAKESDSILIMFYDLYRSNTEAGPSFPLYGKQEYGYDIESAITQFEQDIPKDKLIPVYPLYGYRWIVDKTGKPIKKGTAITQYQYQNLLNTTCKNQVCTQKLDELSRSEVLQYTNEEGDNVVVWIETLQSLKDKQEFMNKRGIYHRAYFAEGYGDISR
jgi:spore germination protein YaaH